MAQEFLPILKIEFFPMVSGRPQGSGIGLSITQSIISRHHGWIEVNSVPGLTQVDVIIPLRLPMSSATVWVVDDDRSIRWVLEKALQGAGLEHAVFDSAKAARKALEANTPHRCDDRHTYAW